MDNRILLGRRKGLRGAGEFSFPGGHLEYMEFFADCAHRETAEECGIKIKNIRFQFLANLTQYAPQHYVHVGLIADWESGVPRILEPERSESWDWYGFDKLPQPLFKPCQMAIESLQVGANYFDIN